MLEGLSIEGIGNLTLDQYKAILEALKDRHKERSRNLLMLIRAANLEPEAYQNILDSLS